MIPDIKDITLSQKIAQLFFMGFRGNNISDNSEIIRDIKNYCPGGVILFDKDMIYNKPINNIESPQQVKNLTQAFQNAAPIPLLIGIDQEGGIVNRLKTDYGFPETKSHYKLGQENDVIATFKEGEKIAGVLSKIGINLNFAPVVDVALNPKSSIIAKKERSFSADVNLVIEHAEAYIKGHNQHNIITCCKHFPGHGSAEGDTHAGFVDVTHSWHKKELKPYEYLIERDLCPMIMSAHIFNSKLDPTYPSTLSKTVITDLLRHTLHFTGVVISDDMQMRAISDHYSLKESLEIGLNAGLDMFCFGNNLLETPVLLHEAIEAVLQLVKDHSIPEERINSSVSRILELKSRFLNQ